MAAVKTKRRTKKDAPKIDVYQSVTDKIMAALEAGTIPWEKPWRSVAGVLPTSMSSRKTYRGVNVWLLSLAAQASGYRSPYWGTYNQISELGGQVQRGEKSTSVILWKPVVKKEEDDSISRFLVIRSFAVFNAEQADWADGSKRPADPVMPETTWDALKVAEMLANLMPQRPEIKHGGNRAYYSPNLDFVGMPPTSSFDAPDGYYATLYHELVHSTGHKSRVGREGIEAMDGFGSEKYSREELVAEMGASYLCSEAGIPPRIDQSAAYLASWLKALNNDKTMVVKAAAQASKAVDFILDRKDDR